MAQIKQVWLIPTFGIVQGGIILVEHYGLGGNVKSYDFIVSSIHRVLLYSK